MTELNLPQEEKSAQLPDEPYMYANFHDLTVGETQTLLMMLCRAMNLRVGRENGRLFLTQDD